MLINNMVIVTLIIVLLIHSFLFGYLFGHYTNKNGVNDNTLFNKLKDVTKKNISNISIDDKKFVVDIKTNNLEKKYDSLGEIKQSQENITDSVNKLKNLKG